MCTNNLYAKSVKNVKTKLKITVDDVPCIFNKFTMGVFEPNSFEFFTNMNEFDEMCNANVHLQCKCVVRREFGIFGQSFNNTNGQ